MKNLLNGHPDGLDKHILAVDARQYPPGEIQARAEHGIKELDEIVIFANTFDNKKVVVLFFGADLVPDTFSKGNDRIDQWAASENGIHYRDTVLNYLGVNPAYSSYGVLRFSVEDEISKDSLSASEL